MIRTNIKFSKAAAKFIKVTDKPTKSRIKNAIDGLLEIPPKGDIKVMQGYHPTAYRLRIGKYRLIYEFIDSDTLYIRDIDSRGDIYK